MEAVVGILGIIAMLCMVMSVWYLLRTGIAKKDKKRFFFKRFWISSASFLILAITSGALISNVNDEKARELGFASTEEFISARDEDITNPSEWNKFKEAEQLRLAEIEREKQIEAQAIAKAAEAEALKLEQERLAAEKQAAQAAAAEKAAQAQAKLEKDKACRLELECWGEKAILVAGFDCKKYIERFAKFDFEWTDGLLEPKFSHYRWKNKSEGIVTTIGDKIKMQNGFGAWQHMTYECDIEPGVDTVFDVRVKAGRIR